MLRISRGLTRVDHKGSPALRIVPCCAPAWPSLCGSRRLPSGHLPALRTSLHVGAVMGKADDGAKRSVLWFRKGLRLHDNAALLQAADGAASLFPIFVMDPALVNPQRCGANRTLFLLESLRDLDQSLRSRGSRLIVLRGDPAAVVPNVLRQWGATDLCFEADFEPYSNTRDAAVTKEARAMGVRVHAPVSHTLYDPRELVRLNGGKPALTMQAFTSLCDRAGDPPAPAPDPPATLPSVGDGEGAGEGESRVPWFGDAGIDMPEPQGSDRTPFRGGETEALARLDRSMRDEAWVCGFAKPDTNPAAFDGPSTTVLSPYLQYGCLSARLFHQRLLSIYRRAKGKHSQPPVSLRGQMLWRDFFSMCAAYVPHFGSMAGNPICRQMDWDDDDEFHRAWEEARTGYPWIDAIMMQLRQWGWMHHLARHSVACFLTRGDLYVSWERGRDTFERLLVDHDWALNQANWQWLSASTFFHQFFRVYSPVTFGKKYDPSGHYVRHFIPALRNMPDKYIYEPWKAPKAVQEKAGCIIGKDYPKPIVAHDEARRANLDRMGKAYERNRERGYGSWKGNDQMVGVDGKPIAQSGGGGGASGGGASGGGSGSKRGRGAEEGSATPGKGGKRGRVSKE